MLLSATTANAQEFPVVGDWANKAPSSSSSYGGLIPGDPLWAEIDALRCNWLKVILDEASTTTDVILEHRAFDTDPYKYIVDRASTVYPYTQCWRQDVGQESQRRAWSNFLSRYVRGSFALRLQPESDFDYVNRDEAHGRKALIAGAETTPFKAQDETYNAIESRIGRESEGVIAHYPTANDLKDAFDVRISDLFNVTASYMTRLTLHLKLANIPPDFTHVYTVRIRLYDGTNWNLAATVNFTYSDPDSPFQATTDWQIVTRQIDYMASADHVMKDIEVTWDGDVDASLDWVEISTLCSREVLHDPATETTIRSAIAWYDNFTGAGKPYIAKLFTSDETGYPEMYNLGFVNGLITDELDDPVPGFSFYIDGTPGQIYKWGYLHLAGINEMSVTGWAFHWDPDISTPIFDDGPNTVPAQDRLQAAASNYRPLAEAVRDGGSLEQVFWPVIQTHGQPDDDRVKTRFPRHEEIKANIGLALSYGGKGIVEHVVHGWEDYTGLVGDHYLPWTWRNETTDSVGNRINPRLRGVLGAQLLDLKWEETWEGGYKDLAGKINLQKHGNAKCVAVAARPVAGVNDPTAYVQLADFRDASNARDFIFVVNKRTMNNTLGDRIIELTFDNSSDLFFQDFESHEIEVIPPSGIKTSKLPAGDFCLLRVAGNTLTEDLIVDNVMYVRAGAEYHVSATLVVAQGAHIFVEDGAVLHIENNGALVLDHGILDFAGSGSLRLSNPEGLSGTGTIMRPNICATGDFVIPAGSDLTMLDCGTFSFDCVTQGVNHYMSVLGALRLRGSGCSYEFGDDLDNIYVDGYGVIDVLGTVTLNGLPHINVNDQGSFLAYGNDENNRCVLKFHDHMEFNTQSIVRMEYALVTSVADSEEWDGMLVAGDNALVDLSYVDITNVYSDASLQGTGVHFYHASNPQNRISYCNILRQNKADKSGDGIFLQPGAGSSYVDIQCSETRDDWWTGVTSVSSEIDITGLTSSANLRGLGAHLDGNIVDISQSILNSNTFQGIFAENSDIFLGKDVDGLNQITQNGDVQIELTLGSRVIQQPPKTGGINDIGHSSPAVPRIMADGTSSADMRDNYWLANPPDQAMFVEVNQGSIDWNPYLTASQIGPGSEWTCEVMQKRRSPALLNQPTRAELIDFARAGRMSEVYTLLDSAITNAGTSAGRVTLLRELMRMEIFHLREFPDSAQASRNRLLHYVRRQQTNISAPFAGDLVALQAVYFTFAGFPDSADMQFDMLARSYANTAAYRNSLHARLCNSFIKLDSAAIDETIIAMNAAGLDSSSLRLARTERRAYYRCKKSGLLPKRMLHDAEIALPGMTIAMTAHPNPANPTTSVSMVLPEAMDLRVTLLTVDGRELRTVFEGRRDKGLLTLPFDLTGLQSGVYLCTLKGAGYTGMTRIVTLK